MPDMTPDEMRAYIEEAPLPGDGAPPFELEDRDAAYDLAGRSLARAFLTLCDERPELLDVPSREDDPSGVEASGNEKLWRAFEERWPEGDDWIGGATGFMFGWAHNAVRYALGRGPTGNPALVTIG